MNIPKLTLDTTLLFEYWKQGKNKDVTEELLALAKQGKVDLAVTARVRADIPKPPLADRLNELPELKVEETGSVPALDYWVLGRDMLGDEEFKSYWPTAFELAKTRVEKNQKPPNEKDWDHLHAHYLLKRDAFLTWDNGIICLTQELKDKFGINIIKPDDYLQIFTANNGG